MSSCSFQLGGEVSVICKGLHAHGHACQCTQVDDGHAPGNAYTHTHAHARTHACTHVCV